jgi:hypothetical protein
MSDDAAEFSGGDPIDAASAEIHRRTLVLLGLTGLEESEQNYLAAAEVVIALRDRVGLTAAVEATSLDVRCITGDALDRLAKDTLEPGYHEEQYVAALLEAERVSGLSLDHYDRR